MIRFGPAGNSDSFKEMGYKSSLQVADYLNEMKLDTFEYQCGRGIRIGEKASEKIKIKFEEIGATISLHAPYFISLSGTIEKKRLKSVDYILDSAKVVNWMGGNRIIVHSGSASRISREEAMNLAKNTLALAQEALDENGLSHIIICPETMGKAGQLGTLEEIIDLCSVDERFIPCIDFGHLNARSLGGIKTKEDYAEILDAINNELGEYRGKNFHSHFSKVEYTIPGGEKKHLTFEDTEYGPEFEALIELCRERNLTPTIICESAGTQAEDAQTMKKYYNDLK